MSSFFDPTTADLFADENLESTLRKCIDVRSRNKVYESLEKTYYEWQKHIFNNTTRKHWENIYNKKGIDEWAKKLNAHIQWVKSLIYITVNI